MSQILLLDSGPLGLITHPQRSTEVVAVTEWLSRCLLSGSRVMVPAIVYYELRRELLRARKTFSLGRLDAFINAAAGRYVPLTDEALRLAAELWAKARQDGRPTADGNRALRQDVHLGRFQDLDNPLNVYTRSLGGLNQQVASASRKTRFATNGLMARVEMSYFCQPVCQPELQNLMYSPGSPWVSRRAKRSENMRNMRKINTLGT